MISARGGAKKPRLPSSLVVFLLSPFMLRRGKDSMDDDDNDSSNNQNPQHLSLLSLNWLQAY